MFLIQKSWKYYTYIVNNDYQQDLRVLYTFIPNKLFGQLVDIFPKKMLYF